MMKRSMMCGLLLAAVGCKGKDTKDEAPKAAEAKAGGGGDQAPAKTTGSRKAVKVGAGDGFACAVLDSGGVRCWGRNDYGERGTAPGADDAATPVDVPGVSGATELVVGGDGGASGDIACAWTKSGDVWCWGAPAMLPDGDGSSTPRAVSALKGALSIALGGGTAYFVKPDGTVWGWGSAAFNSLADGTTGGGKTHTTPVAIPGVAGAKQVVAGQNHGCALLGDGTATCWGYSSKAQLATPVAGLTGATALFAEAQRDEVCALTAGGTMCWDYRQQPAAVAELAGVTKIAGRNHMCALAGDGGVLCWGDDNGMGQLGRSGSPSKPAKVEGLSGKAIDVAVGHVFACAALDGGGVACWGYNQRGQLGDGTLMDRKTATAVAAITADAAPPAADGLREVQEGPKATAWDGLPAACKNGPIAITHKAYAGKTFAVKGAKADVQAGGKTIVIDLADHALHAGWAEPRGTQGELGLRLAHFKKEGDDRVPADVDLGTYKLGTDEERLVSPTFQVKTGSVNLVDLSLTKGIEAGSVTLTHLDDAWVCGELALAAGDSSVKGPFAAPRR